MVRRRPDGIVQIRRRPLWRVLVGRLSTALLVFGFFCAILLVALAAALLRFPELVLLLGGCAALALAAARWALTGPHLERVPVPPTPPRDAA